MPKGRDSKTYKVSRKRKKISNKTADKATTGNQSTAGSSTKQDDETGEEMVKSPKQLKIEEPTKKIQETDDDSFKAETTDDSDLPSYSRSLNLNESVTEDDSINLEESSLTESPNINTPNEMQMEDFAHCEPQSSGIHKESNPDDPPPASQLTSETKDKQHKPLSSVSEESHLDEPPPTSQLKSETKDKQHEQLSGVSEESNLDDPSTASQLKSETENQQHEPQTPSVPEKSNIDSSTIDRQLTAETEVTQRKAQTSSVSGELKLDDSTATTSKEKEQKKIESTGKLETELDTDGSSTITCSSKERWFSDTGSDKESSDSDGSKGVSLSSGNKKSESGSVFSYPSSDESSPPSVVSVVSSQPLLLDLDSRSADQENTSESMGEGNVQQNNPNVVVPDFMLKKYKEFSSSSGSDSKNE